MGFFESVMFVAFLGSVQAATLTDIPEQFGGVWFPTIEGRTIGLERIDVQRDRVDVSWRGERASCTIVPGRRSVVSDRYSSVPLTCQTSQGTLRMGLTRLPEPVLIVHVVGPGNDDMHVFVSTRGATAGPGASRIPMPQFPWPPPRWTSRLVLPEKLEVTKEGELLGDIFNRLRIALDRAAISDWSVYAVGTDGFAIIARLENIDDEGRPTSARWQAPAVRSRAFSISDYLTGLFRARAGRYRVLTLIVTAAPITASATPADRAAMDRLLVGGAGTLSNELGKVPLPASGHCEALVYEFFKPSEDDPPAQVIESALSAAQHLSGAGLWRREDLPQ